MYHTRQPTALLAGLAWFLGACGLHGQTLIGQWFTDGDSQGGKITWYVSGDGSYRQLAIKNIGLTKVQIDGVYANGQRLYWPATDFRFDPVRADASGSDPIHGTGFNATPPLEVRIDWHSVLEDDGTLIAWSERKQSPTDAECVYVTGEQVVGGRHQHWIHFENAAWNRHPDGVMQVDVFGGQPARYLGRSGFLDRFKAQNFCYVDDAAAGQWSWQLEWYHRRSEGGGLVPGDWVPDFLSP